MTHRMERCKHCKITYAYQTSGWGCHDKENDDIYCPECMRKILKALEETPVRMEPVWLPLSYPSKNPMTIEKFEAIKAEQEKDNPFFLKLYYLTGYKNIRWDFLNDKSPFGRPLKYKLSTNTDTNEKLLEIEVEQDTESGEIGGPW